MIDHEEITRVMQAKERPGVGISPNPYAAAQPEWCRRKAFKAERELLTEKIVSLFEPRYITSPETSETIESIITMTDSRKVLEIGMHTGFTALHILRAIIGKPDALLVSIDARPALDREFFSKFSAFRFLEGWTPGILETLKGTCFDLIFVDSDHSLEHTRAEFEMLKHISRIGTIFIFHDMPLFSSPENHEKPPVRKWLEAMNRSGEMTGACLPSCWQADGLLVWGENYPTECSPGLGIFIR